MPLCHEVRWESAVSYRNRPGSSKTTLIIAAVVAIAAVIVGFAWG